MYIYANYPPFLCQTGSGSTYVIWGRKQCPPNNYTEQVYSGIVYYCKYFICTTVWNMVGYQCRYIIERQNGFDIC